MNVEAEWMCPWPSLEGEVFRFAGGEAASVGWAELAGLVARQAAATPDSARAWVLVLRDPAAVLVASLAAWSLGRSIVFPSSLAPEAVGIALRESGGVLCAAEPELPDGTQTDVLIDPRPPGPLAEPISGGEFSRLRVKRHLRCATFYTSGSTGAPKPCHKTFGQLLGEAELHASGVFGQVGKTPALLMCSVPPYHIYGFLFGVLSPLLAGLPILARPTSVGPAYDHLLATAGATHLISTPAHLLGLLGPATAPLSSLRLIVSSGAPLASTQRAELGERHDVSILEVLGSTETGGIATRARARDCRLSPGEEDHWAALPGVNVGVSPDRRMLVSSPFVSSPNNEPLVCEDRIELLGSRFRHLGRTDRVEKIAGKRVSLDALELCVGELPGVESAHALAKPVGGLRGTEVLLVVAAEAAAGLSARSLQQHLLRSFDRVVVPRRYRVVEHLPCTDTGKVTRSALLSLFEPETPEPLPGELQESRSIRLQDDIEVQLRHHAESGIATFSYELLLEAHQSFFQGHFPGYAILPGVVQLHTLVLIVVEGVWPDLGEVQSVKRLKFTCPLHPGDTVQIGIKREEGADRVAFQIARLLPSQRPAAQGTILFRRKQTAKRDGDRDV